MEILGLRDFEILDLLRVKLRRPRDLEIGDGGQGAKCPDFCNFALFRNFVHPECVRKISRKWQYYTTASPKRS